ncbi:NAP1-related protein 2 isoform X1 [Populus alba]|uniref:NAP1-related protein 2 isoform X1 n=1 Tax=Populus alba TaxID=43335 RepID=UPI00158C996D|nr:NAP1-related protein 2-like isoform X1 [Populus alba]
MVADNKGKKLKVAEKGEEDNNQIDEELILTIEKLQEIQDDLEKINEEASDKVLEVEQKYNEIRKPVYDKRNEIIKSIPDFWLTAFLSHPALGILLSEEDQKMFKFLSSLEVEDSKDVKSGYSITFNFEPNPYFEETKLIKSFAFHDEGTTEITATPISWKEGMGLPNGVSHENKGNKRLLADESFFSWFSNTQPKGMIDDMQDEVAEIIKEDLWPNPLSYFNIVIDLFDPDEEDFDGDEADEGEKDGDDSEEEDDGQEEDDDDEEEDDDTGK